MPNLYEALKKVTFQEMFVLFQVVISTADFFPTTLRTIAVNIPLGSFYLLRFGLVEGVSWSQ